METTNITISLIKNSSYEDKPELRIHQFRKTRVTLIIKITTTLILNRVLGCVHSYELWDHIPAHFKTLTCAKAQQLDTELHSAFLEGRSIAEYLPRIKVLADALAFVGDHVPSQQHIDLTLGLSQEFSTVIYAIESKFHMVQLWKLRRCFWLMRCIFKS